MTHSAWDLPPALDTEVWVEDLGRGRVIDHKKNPSGSYIVLVTFPGEGRARWVSRSLVEAVQ